MVSGCQMSSRQEEQSPVYPRPFCPGFNTTPCHLVKLVDWFTRRRCNFPLDAPDGWSKFPARSVVCTMQNGRRTTI
jgi:hypothetical protein